jgi:hypothetical protein
MKKIFIAATSLVVIGLIFTTSVVFGAPLVKVVTENILGRKLISVPSAQKVKELQQELIIGRSLRTMALRGSSWEQYKNVAGNFPALQSVLPTYNKMDIDWSNFNLQKPSDFVVVASDVTGGIPMEILVHKSMVGEEKNLWGVFLIRMKFDSGDYLYGPFFDDISRLTGEMTTP